MSEEPKSKLLMWVDIETTGLLDSDDILEVALIVTDESMKILRLGPDLIIRPSQWAVDHMSDYVREMHTKTGLLERAVDSPLTPLDAEKELLRFVEGFASAGQVPMAGSSIAFDRKFLERDMPTFSAWFHYRNADVSALNEFMKRWIPDYSKDRPQKREFHTPVEDLKDSISLAIYYKNLITTTKEQYLNEVPVG